MKAGARKAALLSGEPFYNTGIPCKRNHIADRYTNNGVCVQCLEETRSDQMKRYYSNPENAERRRYQARTYIKNMTPEQKALRRVRHDRDYQKNKAIRNAKVVENWRNRKLANPVASLLQMAKLRAKRNGISFDIVATDIEKPEYCPVLKMKLNYGTNGYRQDDTASLDRVDSTMGYVKGNVIVVSWRANKLKQDATKEELKMISDYYNKE